MIFFEIIGWSCLASSLICTISGAIFSFLKEPEREHQLQLCAGIWIIGAAAFWMLAK